LKWETDTNFRENLKEVTALQKMYVGGMISKWILKDYVSFKVRYRVFCCENGGG
jgi:hypothetical protein